MNNNNGRGNRDDNETSLSSTPKSPYNLCRNQAQPGAVTKRNNSVMSRKDITGVTVQSSNHDVNPSFRHTTLHRSRQQYSSTPSPRQQHRSIPSSRHQRSSTASTATNRVQQQEQLSSEDEQPDQNMLIDVIDRSDDEQEAKLVKQRAERERNKLPTVRHRFDHIDGNIYMCQICNKVRNKQI
jgi:hypothetical protein